MSTPRTVLVVAAALLMLATAAPDALAGRRSCGSYGRSGFSIGFGYSNYGYRDRYSIGFGYSDYGRHDRFAVGFRYSSGGYYGRPYSYCGPRYYRSYYARPYYYSNYYYRPSYYYTPSYYDPYCYTPPRVVYSAPAVVYSAPAVVYHSAPSYSVHSYGCVKRCYPGTSTYYCQTHRYSPSTNCVLYEAPANTAVVVAAPQTVAPPKPNYDTPAYPPAEQDFGSGWPHLSRGDFEIALKAFEAEANRNPGDAMPKLGCALAAAAVSQYDKTQVLIRAAISDDVSALSRIPLDDSVRQQINNLLKHYSKKAEFEQHRAESYLILAALDVALGNLDRADLAARNAAHFGDGSSELNTLRGYINKLRADDRGAAPAKPLYEA